MTTIKKKTLSAAVMAALGAAGVMSAAHAVNINDDGHGEVLIYPYYTVQGGRSTALSIVNTTGQVKAVKIRFREGKNSREVLDFNLYLSPFDVWTGSVISASENGPGKLVTNDKSCTVPAIPAEGVEFRNYEFSGAKDDNGGTELSRTREGYVEGIEMGVVDATLSTNTFRPDYWATHVNGVPRDCAAIVAAFAPGGVWASDPQIGMSEPLGGLFGTERLLNVPEGTEYGVDALALEHFYDPGIFDPPSLHSGTGSLFPTLAEVNPSDSLLIEDGNVYYSMWAPFTTDAVSALIMRDRVMNEYTVNPAVEAETDWVVMFPTKWDYVDVADLDADGNFDEHVIPPFTEAFRDDGKACESVIRQYFDREERFVQGDVDFSPLPPAGSFELCYEVNVVKFGTSNVLGSENLGVTFSLASGFVSGWAALGFGEVPNTPDGVHDMTSLDQDIYYGLPVLGFRATRVLNGNVGVGAAYGGEFEHRYDRDIAGSMVIGLN